MVKNLNVLLVHNYYQIPGGEDVVVANEKKMLEENGHKVFLYTRKNNEISSLQFFRKLLLPFTSLFSIKTYREVKKIIIAQSIDIIHVHNTLPLISPSVYYAAFRTNTPVVQTLHNFRLLCPSGSFYRNGQICQECADGGLWRSVKHTCYRDSKAQTLIVAAMLKLHRLLGTYKKIDAYICLSKFNKEKLSSAISEDRLCIKPNFIPQSGYCIDNDSQNIRSNGYYLFMGRLEENKGIALLIDVFSNLPDKHLVIIGDGTMKTWLLDRIERDRLKNVSYEGYCAGEKKLSIILGAKALIVPSQLYEAFSLVTIEAFSYGLPVIAGKIGTLASIVKDPVNGLLFEYNSEKSLAETLERFEKLEYAELSKNARMSYEKNFTQGNNYRTLMDIYEKITMNDYKAL